jgi:hypothetical protein
MGRGILRAQTCARVWLLMSVLREQFWLPCRNMRFSDQSNDDVTREMAA